MVNRQFQKSHWGTVKDWWMGLGNPWKTLFLENLEMEYDDPMANIHRVFSLEELDLSRSEIRDLSPLKYFGNLRYLDLSMTDIDDLTPLEDLVNLQELHFTGSKNLDVSQLSRIPNLEVLDLSYPETPPVNFDELYKLDQLKAFYGNGCSLNSIAEFVALDQLEVLCLYFNIIPAKELRAFKELYPDCKVMC
ncbi:hypothetical protein [Pontibacter sp. G13]|uniref:hypothetical protein n=1 Tax=Pontibacter sp. G13 TaxID=3074898 RepID=UPI00288B03D3|nr:hypothetical protein [Pontibacter sp. G13]WNJ15969.1 hypothetical protein RJD25_13990 [Pontibacter sp. G13]